MKDLYDRTAKEIADYYMTLAKGGSKRVLAQSHIDLLEALKDASNMLLSTLQADLPDAYDVEHFIEHIDSVIKKAE